MAATVVPAAATAATFEESFGREVLRSERLRLSLVIAAIVLIYIRGLILWIFFPSTIVSQLGGSLNMGALAGLGLAALAYETAVLIRLTVLIRRGKRLPTPLRYVNALVEVSIPTLVMLFAVDVSSPAFALYSPAAWGYGLFIVLATLRLDFWLCIFTGVVAAVEYGVVGWYLLSQPQTVLIDPVLTAPMNHGMRVGLLLLSGVAAGIVSLQIRRQFIRALRSVEE